MIHLALDVGEKRIGVAVSDETETLASPRTPIRRVSNAEEELRAAACASFRIRERLDAAAAAVILQDYLDARNRGEAQQIHGASMVMGMRQSSGDEVEG